MKKWLIGGVLVLALVVVLFLFNYGGDLEVSEEVQGGLGGSVSEGSGTVSDEVFLAEESSGETVSEPRTFEVEIVGFKFVPEVLDVSVGDSVVWTNMDLARHTATSEDWSLQGIDSGLLSKGESYSYTFEEMGEYDYYCVPHPYMKGKVIVS